MYVGLKNIQHLFSKQDTLLTNSDGIHCLTGWTKLHSAPQPYTEHLLYACEYREELLSFSYEKDMHLLCIVEENTDLETLAARFPQDLSLLLLAQTSASTVYTQLQTFFNMQCGVGMFGQTLLEFLAFENGLQPAIDHSFGVFRNPVFVFDPNYNLIAATWDAIKKLNIQDQVVLTKHFSEDDFKMASRQNNLHQKIRKSEIPIRAYNETLGYEQLYCEINTQKPLGHIVVSAVNKPLEDIDSEFLLILKKYINEQMKKDSFIRTSRGLNYEYFLKDLLDDKIAVEKSNLSRMQYMETEFKGNKYCMVVETARSATTVNPAFVRNILESRFPNCKTLVYNGQIILLLSILSKQLIPEEYIAAAGKICEENGLYMGMSNCFQDIFQFKEFYMQALRAIELGVCDRDAPNLFCYEDYYLEHVKNVFTTNESSETFCHPKMKFLMDYDRTHHSELAYTLYMYLIHERNLAAAADAMDMHRSSLVYRFKKINSLIGEEFDDYKERMYMILSYEMNSKKSEN